jgi:hypothetical protein
VAGSATVLLGGGFAFAQLSNGQPNPSQSPLPPTESEAQIEASASERLTIVQAELDQLENSMPEGAEKEAAIRARERQVDLLREIIQQAQASSAP